MNTEPAEEDQDVRKEAFELTARALREFLIWVTDDMCGTQERAGKRAFVTLWAIDDRFHRITQQALARELGLKDKQSIGRVVEEFRKKFGDFTPRKQCKGGRVKIEVEFAPLENENENENEEEQE